MNIERLSEYYDDTNHRSATVIVNKDTNKYAVEVRMITGFDSLEQAENYAEDWTQTKVNKDE